MTLDREQLHAWWQQRPLREKLLLGGVALAAVLALLDASITSPLEKKLRRTLAEQAMLQARAADVRADPPAAQALAQEAALRERLSRAERSRTELDRRVGDAARLPETLRAIVATVGTVKVLELDLSGDAEPPAPPGSPDGGPRKLHRLPITLKVAGSWDELQMVLTQIERHADALQWQSLVLDNAEWPAIQLTLKAWVWSHDPRWGATS